LRHQSVEVFDVVQGQRAVGQIEGLAGQREAFHIRSLIGDRRIPRVGLGPRQHLLGQFDPEHLGRARLARPTAEPAVAATEIEDPAPAQIRQQRAQGRPFRRSLQPLDGAGQPSIAGEELVRIVDVLRHHAAVA
jgi:hypothetical protein